MREHLKLMAVFAVLLTAVPFISLLRKPQAVRTDKDLTDTVKILHCQSGEVEEVPLRDYIIGAVFAQMPADYEDEALKAQAVLAHTYILRRREEEKLSPTEELRGALISDDTEKYQAFFTLDQAKAYYGDGYAEALAKVSGAADYAKDRYLSYAGKPVIGAFHAVSCGKTESALNAWGQAVPYLVTVESEADANSKLYVGEQIFTEKELFSLLGEAFPDADFDGELNITVTERTEAGCAGTVELCGKVYIPGRSFARALGLSSACFEVTEREGEYIFACKGRGHLVGMSQYGANAMAKESVLCGDILAHYFPGTVLICTKAGI